MAIDRGQYAGIAQAVGCEDFMGVKPPSPEEEDFYAGFSKQSITIDVIVTSLSLQDIRDALDIADQKQKMDCGDYAEDLFYAIRRVSALNRARK